MKPKHRYKLLETNQDASDSGDEIEMVIMETNEPINQAIANDKKVLVLSTACKPLRGLFCAFMSCFFFAIGSAITKLCRGSLDAFQIVLIRCFVQLLFCIPIISYYRLQVLYKFSTGTQLILIIRGLLGGTTLILIFYSFQKLPLGDASAIIFSSSIYTLILARILLKEKFVYLDIIVLIATIAGVILVSKPTIIFSQQSENGSDSQTPDFDTSGNNYSTLGYTAAIIASVMVAGAHIALRKLPTIHYTIPLFYFSVTGVLVTSFTLVLTQNFLIPSDQKYWAYAVLVGVCGFAGQVLMTKAYQMEKAGPVAIVRQCDIVFAYVFQVVLFDDPLEIVSFIGTILIISGGFTLAVKKLLLSTKSCERYVGRCVFFREL